MTKRTVTVYKVITKRRSFHQFASLVVNLITVIQRYGGEHQKISDCIAR